VHADEGRIAVKSDELEVVIRREELGELIGERYPTKREDGSFVLA
jgi:hypothetical protein